MRILPKVVTWSRRGFLRGGGLALGAAAVAPAALAMPAADGLAGAFQTLGPATGKTLLRMARDVFPHDRLADRYYADAIAPCERAAGKDPALKALLQDGVAELDRAAVRRFGQPYAEVAAEDDRVSLLKAIEQGPFFQKIRGDMVTSLYDNKAVWPLLGYEGSSWEKGGYLARGFNDIDWL
ncbi:gluconate 2-dehydrogenase subunit 3 family protein [Duganella sp. LX47W]|uniref:Gluconate 2-dehydrogenase subunit 3 family protein n=2 Tax=Rugamonas apoptosis TaxID=2758570 RepID=A0A7W2FBP7_9BURK|nr:gluconate 2-dehydrogenase subunit 3 family protein [Rugamonas apoptosis]